MAIRVSPYLGKTASGRYLHYCPACDEAHYYAVDIPQPSNGAQWNFNGNVQKPSFSPSMLIKIAGMTDIPASTCHYFITDGKIIYCGDCTHNLKGQTIDLPPLPIGWCGAEGTA